MAAVAVASLPQLQQLSRLEQPSSIWHSLLEVTSILDEVSSKIEQDWESCPPDIRERIQRLVTLMIAPRTLRERLLSLAYLPQAVSLVAGSESKRQGVTRFLIARRRFIDAALDAKERDDARYQAELTEALSQKPADGQEAMTASEFNDWLTGL